MNVTLRPPSYTRFSIRAMGQDTWRLEQDWEYDGAREVVKVPAGFETDGASVPPMFWWFCPPMRPRYLAAALIHDYLYSTQTMSRKEADLIFYRVMIEDGEKMWRAWLMYRAVRVGGWLAWRRARKEQSS